MSNTHTRRTFQVVIDLPKGTDARKIELAIRDALEDFIELDACDEDELEPLLSVAELR